MYSPASEIKKMDKQKKLVKSKGMKVYSLGGMANFKGFIKNGLDSSTLINLIVCFDSKFDEFRNRGFTFPPNLFYYHEISWSEVIGVLINEYKFTEKEAKESLKKLIGEFNLSPLARDESTDESYEKIVEEANERVIKKENNEKLRIGEKDIIIIGGFLKNKINFVHTGDKGFQKTCEELRLNVVPLPKRDFKKEKEIKKWMEKRIKD